MKLRKTFVTAATTVAATATALALTLTPTATAQDSTTANGSQDAYEVAMDNPALQGSVMGSAVLAVIPWFLWCLSTHTSSQSPEDRCYF